MKSSYKKIKRGTKEFFKNLFKVIRRPEMVILPGCLAFFFVLAVIPSLSLISYGASILNLSVDFLRDFFAKSFSPEMANMILGVQITKSAGIWFYITIIVGLYIASNGADAIITTSNTIYGNRNKNWFIRRIKALGLTFVIILLFIFMLIVPVVGQNIVELVREVNLNDVITNRIETIFYLLQGPLSWLIMFLFIKVIFVIAPDKKRKGRVINYGALFTTVGWIIVTKIYSIYATVYADYSILYGSLASIVVLMVWLYFLSYIFMLGMALNYEKDENNLSKSGTIK